jgi:polyisoprenoid-binding protein YceI
MSRDRWIAAAIVAVVAVVAVGAYVAWDQLLRGDEVAPLSLSSPAPATTGPTTAPAATGPATATAPAATQAPAGGSPAASTEASAAPAAGGPVAPETLAGAWAVTEGSVVGYRVREQLGGVTALTDAVGRTSDVTGQATLAAAGDSVQVTAASFTADVTTLESDNDRRDARIRQMGIESDSYPTAAFTLTAPVDVPAEALTGATAQVSLTGDLTIHGVTKPVTIPAEARLADGVVEIVGSLTFPFADFGMTPPSVGDFVKVEPDATLEFLLRLAKA